MQTLRKLRPAAIDLTVMFAGITIAVYGATLADFRWPVMILGIIISLLPIGRGTRELKVQEVDLTNKSLRVRLDHEACMGVGSCVKLAPKVFRLDEKELKSSFISYAPLTIIDEKGASSNTIFRAAQSCPYKAIILEDEATGEQVFP